MSIKKNIIANYIGQFYVTLIGIFLVPVYVKYMGAEAYGLIAFFAMLQTWFFMLDMGLTPTIAREAARFQGGAVDVVNLRKLLRALEVIFIVIGTLGAVVIIASSEIIASQWLQVKVLSLYEVKISLMLMALNIGIRWVSGLYRSAINGIERIVWLNGFNIFIATLRFVLILPILIYINADPTTFFFYQLVVTVLELVISSRYTYKSLPLAKTSEIEWDWRPLRASLKFSLTVAFTGLVWVAVTQTDKLILSGLISLGDYAYFALAVLFASGIMIMSRPVSGALLPRLTALNAEGNDTKLRQLYRNATQLVAVISIPTALIMAFFAEQVLLAWTGSYDIAAEAAPVLAMYALGNGIMAFAAFPYYLQYAKGELKLHLIYNGVFLILFIPSIYLSVKNFGVQGAGYVWLFSNLATFVFYVPLVHNKFAKGMHWRWVAVDIGLIGVPPLLLTLVINQFIEWPHDRFVLSGYLLMILASSIIIGGAGSSKVRDSIRHLIR